MTRYDLILEVPDTGRARPAQRRGEAVALLHRASLAGRPVRFVVDTAGSGDGGTPVPHFDYWAGCRRTCLHPTGRSQVRRHFGIAVFLDGEPDLHLLGSRWELPDGSRVTVTGMAPQGPSPLQAPVALRPLPPS